MGALERQAKESQILDSAAKIFAIKGFGSTKVKDIAKDAGISVGIVYFYYKNKDELYLAVVLRAIELSLAVIKNAQTKFQACNGVEQIIGIIEEYLKFSEENFQFQEVISSYINLVLSMRRDSPFHGITPRMKESAFYKKIQEQQWAPAILFAQIVATGKEEGSIKNTDSPQLIFVNLWSLVIGFDKLYLPDYGQVKKSVELPKINSNKWKKSLLRMARNYLTN